jgi:amidohydrolase
MSPGKAIPQGQLWPGAWVSKGGLPFPSKRCNIHRECSRRMRGTKGTPLASLEGRVVPFQSVLEDFRAQVHQDPELSREEHRTQRRLLRVLRRLGVPARPWGPGTAVTAVLAPRARGPALALRADMDALPVRERTSAPFRSRNSAMHACGHDIHMAGLVGAAAVLRRCERNLKGPVRLIFQPAEEAGGEGGALPLIRQGILKDPPVRTVFGLHVRPSLPLGRYAFRPGVAMASPDRFQIRVRGRGGHAAYPHTAIDPIVAASAVVLGLQTLVSRRRDPVEPAVVSVCRIAGGNKDNIIPDEVELEGTVRTLHSRTRTRFHRDLRHLATEAARSFGARAEVRWDLGYPVLRNTEGLTLRLEEGFRRLFGPCRVQRLDHPWMGGEDFAYYLQRVPGTFLFLGTGDGSGGSRPLHSAEYLPSPRVITAAAAAHLAAVSIVQQVDLTDGGPR